MPHTRGALLLGSISLSILLPLLLGYFLGYIYPEWRWEHHPFHSSIESIGAFSAITIAVLMTVMVNHGHLQKRYVLVAIALIGMGTLDALHGMLYSGKSYVWLHSVATMVGGVLFATVWMPQSWIERINVARLILLVASLTVLFGLLSVYSPELLPVMVNGGEFTQIARLINLSGGVGFLVGSAYFISKFLVESMQDSAEVEHYENLIFANHCLLFGAAGLLFEFSSLWDSGWWWWHLLRLAAYLIVLVYFFQLFKANHHLLQSKKELLEKATHTKDEFMASMSHELRTPLTSIIGNSEFLLDEGICGRSGCPHQDAGNILHSIRNAGNNQLALVNDILDMSKIESGKFTIDEVPYDLSVLLHELEQMFATRSADAGLTFVLDQKNQEPHLLLGDGLRITQILINIVGNAIKFTEQGEVRLTTWVNQGKLTFQIKDTGIGMSRETIDSLFQRFQQADGSISRRFGGNGLGLFISNNLAGLMGGEIDVSSEEGAGSTFQLTIPHSSTDTPAHFSESETSKATSVLEKKLSGTILIAEDTPELQMLERRVLESIGVTVVAVENGQQAVEAVNQHPFDLILMDMQMPVMDGVEATRTLRQQGHDLPIIALTANVMQKHRDAFSEAGCDEFLCKPIDKQELRRVLHRYLILEQEKQFLKDKEIENRRKTERRNEEIAIIDDDRDLPEPRRLKDQISQQLDDSMQIKQEMTGQAEEEVDDELMAIFVSSTTQRKEALEQALFAKDWMQAREAAHGVKGSAASFGYPQLSKMAETLQFAIDEERLDEVPELANKLLTEMGKLLS